ncbi:HupE/UreJ family protein [Oricola thermophila]|uniref:HupE/UreJ family protein n=1 Tax=Oricola thermophila TaxID=2742145 RepID=A0A6N1V919_9HYPH|nr:HupE/UreJ family protein [Oricola thermophila]QKV17446.1 HupE/UreJ family protein [Oricola thermophila]
MRRIATAAALLLATAVPAFAHLDPGEHGSIAAGFSHPLYGVDHILAMVAVGVWAAMIGGRAVWAAPVTFVAVMAAGFAASFAGAPLPFVEPAILASIVAFGLLIALAAPVPVELVLVVTGFFALFHGYAHGSELGAAGALPFGAGFIAATALLHAVGAGTGIAMLKSLDNAHGRLALRVAGGATAAYGVALAVAG